MTLGTLYFHPENKASLPSPLQDRMSLLVAPLCGHFSNALGHTGTCDLTQHCFGTEEQGMDFSVHVLLSICPP